MNADSYGSWEQAVAWLIAQPDRQDLVRDCYFDRPALEAARRFHLSEEWRAVRAFFPETRGRALDVGAGNGVAGYALARDGWDVTALEPDPSALVGARAIRALAGNARLRKALVMLPAALATEAGPEVAFVVNAEPWSGFRPRFLLVRNACTP